MPEGDKLVARSLDGALCAVASQRDDGNDTVLVYDSATMRICEGYHRSLPSVSSTLD